MTLLMKGREKFEQGIQQGKQEEKYNGMLKQISVLKELNIDNDIIIEKVVKTYEVSEE